MKTILIEISRRSKWVVTAKNHKIIFTFLFVVFFWSWSSAGIGSSVPSQQDSIKLRYNYFNKKRFIIGLYSAGTITDLVDSTGVRRKAERSISLNINFEYFIFRRLSVNLNLYYRYFKYYFTRNQKNLDLNLYINWVPRTFNKLKGLRFLANSFYLFSGFGFGKRYYLPGFNDVMAREKSFFVGYGFNFFPNRLFHKPNIHFGISYQTTLDNYIKFKNFLPAGDAGGLGIKYVW